jgi:hypothetical protein
MTVGGLTPRVISGDRTAGDLIKMDQLHITPPLWGDIHSMTLHPKAFDPALSE